MSSAMGEAEDAAPATIRSVIQRCLVGERRPALAGHSLEADLAAHRRFEQLDSGLGGANGL